MSAHNVTVIATPTGHIAYCISDHEPISDPTSETEADADAAWHRRYVRRVA